MKELNSVRIILQIRFVVFEVSYWPICELSQYTLQVYDRYS